MRCCARRALETVLAARIDDREDIPLPSPAAGRPCAVLPVLTAAKVLLYRAMREAGVRKADLARRLGWHGPQMDRLLDLNHASRLDQIEAALAALGTRLSFDLADAAESLRLKRPRHCSKVLPDCCPT